MRPLPKDRWYLLNMNQTSPLEYQPLHQLVLQGQQPFYSYFYDCIKLKFSIRIKIIPCLQSLLIGTWSPMEVQTWNIITITKAQTLTLTKLLCFFLSMPRIVFNDTKSHTRAHANLREAPFRMLNPTFWHCPFDVIACAL